jgi:translation initiation factor IF-1
VTAKAQAIKKSGQVIEALPSATFKVKLDDGSEILAHLAGKMRLNYIRVLVGDRVMIEMSPYDEKRGRIIFRVK